MTLGVGSLQAGSGSESSPTKTAVSYPSKPVHILSHSAPGSNDLFIRALQPYLQKELGQPVVIENVLGAAGRLCCTQVWKSDPDGYTLLSQTIPLTMVGEVMYKAEYRCLEFEHIFAFDDSPYVIAVKKGSPITSFKELIETSKTKRLTNGTSGVGGGMHLQSMVMKTALGVDYDDIPFDGSGGAMLAVMSGDVDFCIIQFDLPLTNQNEVTVLASFDNQRLPQYPDIPTAKELGYEFSTLDSRRCITAPPGTPKEVIDTLIEAFRRAFQYPEFQKWAAERGVKLDPKYGQEYFAVSKQTYDLVYSLRDLIKIE
jgi:tripartite-type tricarboxylate transporter receptor subunit TctC